MRGRTVKRQSEIVQAQKLEKCSENIPKKKVDIER